MNYEDALWERMFGEVESKHKCLSCNKVHLNFNRPICGSVITCINYDRYEKIILKEENK